MLIEKYHGLGNDFLITDYQNYKTIKDVSSFVYSICDRHTGIGADGFIFVKNNPLEMIIYNADGSIAEMCGNGIRCFCKYIVDHKIVTTSSFSVKTMDGIKDVVIVSYDPFIVKVNIGSIKKEITKINLEIDNKLIEGYFLNVGVPHFVVFNNCLDNASLICNNKIFKNKTNVDYCTIIDDSNIKVTTYERGVGPTLACGTGSVASVIVCNKLNMVKENVKVDLVLGSLNISIVDEQIYMEGTAKKVCIINI